jgi:hypothetical protein
MFFLVIILGWVLYHLLAGGRPSPSKEKQWTFIFRSKRQPPITVAAETEGLAVKKLMIEHKIDPYNTIARMDPV